MTFNPAEKRDAHGRWTHLAGLLKSAGGFTHSLESGREVSKGFAVSIPGHTEKIPGRANADQIKRYVGKHLAALSAPKAHLGAWFNGDDKHTYLDVTHIHSNKADALKTAKEHGELAGFDLGSGQEFNSYEDQHFSEIHAGDLSTPDARRSPAVSAEEFQQYAQRGASKYGHLRAGASKPKALSGKNWTALKQHAYEQSREPWGGTTTDTHSGKDIAPDADAYALTVREPGMDSVSVDPNANQAAFDVAMETAKKRYADILSRPGHALGVFHDDDLKRIDIDPVLVTPSLSDVHDIGAYTHAVGGAYHFKSGDGYWPPHVEETSVSKKKKGSKDLSIYTPSLSTADFELSNAGDGKVAFWKQILPKKLIHYTAKDGSRRTLNFDEAYLTDLAKNQAVDKIPFVLADKDNAHTMDPERVRGDVAQLAVREDGLYGKIVFPNMEAAKAVIDNPSLGVSARIREGIQKSDGSTLSRGIIHVLGTLDPQVSGMSGWQTADLSAEQGDVLDLTDEEYMEMPKSKNKKSIEDYTEAEIEAMSDEDVDAFLTEFAPELADVFSDEEGGSDEGEPENEHEKELEPALSNKASSDIELANQRAERASRQAAEALTRLAQAEWDRARSELLSAGVPPFALDLAAPVLNRADDMVIDLSVTDEDDVNVSEVVRGLLDALKGTVDLSNEKGHNGSWDPANGEDPDKALLDQWQF